MTDSDRFSTLQQELARILPLLEEMLSKKLGQQSKQLEFHDSKMAQLFHRYVSGSLLFSV